ncbi:MAG TPA: hypothetical protein VEL47_05380 [Myxococcota bacterium]|nr:hypothetical protein [Myxococcota bacterium]
MGQAQFQKALAMLIRLPEHNRQNLEQFLAAHELSCEEKENLRVLAHHREVNKFGYKMRNGRINYILESIPISLEYVDQENFIDLIKKEFDPKHSLVYARKIYRDFRAFMVSLRELPHEAWRKYLGDPPEFFFDLLEFEMLDSELEFQGFGERPLMDQSPLLHTSFEVLSLEYRIHDFVEKKRNPLKKKSSRILPFKEKTSLLFLKEGEGEYGYQLYEIDDVGINFLKKSLLGRKAKAPSYYQDLVESGLCK